jgi:hypothetical protein
MVRDPLLQDLFPFAYENENLEIIQSRKTSWRQHDRGKVRPLNENPSLALREERKSSPTVAPSSVAAHGIILCEMSHRRAVNRSRVENRSLTERCAR